MFVPELGQSLMGNVVQTRRTPVQFPKDLWHATTPWEGDRWILTARSMPCVPASILDGLGFPCSPRPHKVSLPTQSSSQAAACESTEPPSNNTSHHPRLPLGSKNWGLRSSKGTFTHHSLVKQENILAGAPICAEKLAAPWQGTRIFLDICSGSERPLSAAVLAMGGSVLSIDLLLDNSMNLLCNTFYEQLLHLCGSGIVGYAAASPSCAEYSRLKLRGDPPFPVRTPAFLDGLPDQSMEAYQRVQESHDCSHDVAHA